MAQWYMAIGGQQVGPVSQDDIITSIRSGTVAADTLVFTAGMSQWMPLKDVPALAPYLHGASTPAPAGAMPPPPPGRRAHEIDFSIMGVEMQFVEVELDPGESAVAEAGSMMYMMPGITMETVFGDGSQQAQGSGGLMGALLGAGKRLLTGESLFMTVFTNKGAGKQKVAFAAPYPGKILPMDLRQTGGMLICQRDAFLCAARGVSLGIALQKKLSTGFFGGEGFIMQKLEGDGLAFVHAGGTVVRRELQPGQTLMVDTGCVVAYTPSINFEIQYVGKIKTALFGGEGLFFARISGPGTVWLQSLPFSRLASRVFAAAPQTGRGGREEGSVLGGFGAGGLLGGVLGGDDE